MANGYDTKKVHFLKEMHLLILLSISLSDCDLLFVVEVGEHFGSILACDRVTPIGTDFVHRLEEETTFCQVRVWHFEAFIVDDLLVDSHDVDVDETVDVVAIAVAMRVGRDGLLYLLEFIKHLKRGEFGVEHHTDIEEFSA